MKFFSLAGRRQGFMNIFETRYQKQLIQGIRSKTKNNQKPNDLLLAQLFVLMLLLAIAAVITQGKINIFI
jgi:hypothetical protein